MLCMNNHGYNFHMHCELFLSSHRVNKCTGWLTYVEYCSHIKLYRQEPGTILENLPLDMLSNRGKMDSHNWIYYFVFMRSYTGTIDFHRWDYFSCSTYAHSVMPSLFFTPHAISISVAQSHVMQQGGLPRRKRDEKEIISIILGLYSTSTYNGTKLRGQF